MSFVDQAANLVHVALNPNYQRLQHSIRESSKPMEIIGVVSAIATVIFGLLALASASPISLLISAGFAVCCYNSFQLANNLREISEKPAAYMENYGLSEGLNTARLKTALNANTFACSLIVNFVVDQIDASMRQ